MHTKLSIITVNRNNANGLDKTISSVAEQSFSNFEYIVIDGASTDDSVSIIEKYAEKISYWISEQDKGIYHAMNKGIKQAKGEYCLFLNSCDYLYNSNILENIFSKNYSEDLIYGNQFRVGKKGNRVLLFPEKLTCFHFYAEFIGHNCTFIRRELFDLVGFYNENYKIVSDLEFFVLAVCKHNCTQKYIDQIISVAVDGGISNNPQYTKLVKKERTDVFRKHFPNFVQDYEELYELKYNSPKKKFKRIVKKLIRF